jgi:hypothetical protein
MALQFPKRTKLSSSDLPKVGSSLKLEPTFFGFLD